VSIKAYPNNQQHTILTFDSREKHFILYWDNKSMFFDSPEKIRKAFGKARNVPSVKAMEAWAEEMVASYVKQSPAFDKDRILSEGFGPEAHGDDEEPNDNTRMIT
tara:strand:- start:3 stop:317 length:315 start_codon:yes stop_codon:yes gene_type:complete